MWLWWTSCEHESIVVWTFCVVCHNITRESAIAIVLIFNLFSKSLIQTCCSLFLWLYYVTTRRQPVNSDANTWMFLLQGTSCDMQLRRTSYLFGSASTSVHYKRKILSTEFYHFIAGQPANKNSPPISHLKHFALCMLVLFIAQKFYSSVEAFGRQNNFFWWIHHLGENATQRLLCCCIAVCMASATCLLQHSAYQMLINLCHHNKGKCKLRPVGLCF